MGGHLSQPELELAKIGQRVRIKKEFLGGQPDHEFLVIRVSKGKSCCAIVDFESKKKLLPQRFISIDKLEK